MGRLPSPNRKYQLQSLNDLHHEVLRLTLIGYKPKQIAEMLGITEPTVCNIKNGSKGQMQLAILRGVRDSSSIDIAKDISEFANEAWELAKTLIRDENQPASVRLKYAFEAIGVAGHVKPQRVQVQGSVTHLTTDEINEIKLRARQITKDAGIIDAEYCESQQGPQLNEKPSNLESEGQIAE